METIKKCSSCNNEYNLEEFDLSLRIPKLMESKGLCFSCAFWEYNLELDQSRKERLDYDIPVILGNDQHACIPKDRLEIKPLNCIQPTYRILTDDNKLYTTNTVFFQGVIPPKYVKEFTKFIHFANQLSNMDCLELISRSDTLVAQDGKYYIITEEARKGLKLYV